MNTWSVQDAQARFSELVNACMSEGPQTVTQRGDDVAVLVSIVEWRQLHAVANASLKDLLLSDAARTELLTPPRETVRRRGSTSSLS